MQKFSSALYEENGQNVANERGERRGGLPPATCPTTVVEGEMREMEIRVREKRRERAGVLNEEGRRREEKMGCWVLKK